MTCFLPWHIGLIVFLLFFSVMILFHRVLSFLPILWRFLISISHHFYFNTTVRYDFDLKNRALSLFFHYGSSDLQKRPKAPFVNLSSFNLLKLLKVLDQKQLYAQPSHIVAIKACLAVHFTARAPSGLGILASNKGLTKNKKSNKAVLDKKRCWVFNYFNTTN